MEEHGEPHFLELVNYNAFVVVGATILLRISFNSFNCDSLYVILNLIILFGTLFTFCRSQACAFR